MAFKSPFLLLLLLLLLPFAFSDDPITQYCGGNTFSAANSPLQSNINSVLSDLQKRTPQSGYAISSHGHATTTIYGLTRCRGDIPAEVCSSCITDAASQLPSLCPNRTDARIWYEYCFLRYDADDFVGKSDTSYAVIVYNVENATDPGRFSSAVKELMGGVSEAAARSYKRFGLGAVAFTEAVTIRGLAQCTRDLTAEVCRECLEAAVRLLIDYRKGCRVLYSSCVVRYEIYDFLFKRDSPSGGAGDVLTQKMINSSVN